MAGTAKGYDATHVHQAPGDLWIIGTPPTDSAVRLTLATDGTPDSAAHPSSICLGLCEAGIDFDWKGKYGDISADQVTAPIDRVLIDETATITTELSQQAVDLLQQALSTGTYATASGYKQLTFGGTYIDPSVCIAAISPKRAGSGLFIVSMLFKCNSIGGLQVRHAKAKKSTHKIQFSGLVDLTRTAGKNIGVHYETI